MTKKIAEFKWDDLKEVSLTLSTFDRKKTGQHEIGVGAEEVANVIPKVVSTDPMTQEPG